MADSAAPYVPAARSLAALRAAADGCRGCDLYRHATQTVFGAGLRSAKIILIGEQPGDQEDEQGKPFVGPAGKMLDDCLLAAGIDRSNVYLTNAVKHFKFATRGARRLHKRPSAREVRACRPWLEAELGLIRPQVVVCLGATAAQSLLGPQVRIQADRGQWHISAWCERTLVTYHPSALLRAPDADRRTQMKKELISDLTMAAAELDRGE